ncbi:MAG: response regulator [Pirellulales bacterium]
MIPTIMLVDDDFLNIALMEDLFELDDIPAKLQVARTGEESLPCASQCQPALILMDVRLPGIDGLEATQILKNDPRTRDIPVWVITAYAMPGDAEKARRAGCSEYITKPTDTRELTERLRKFLGELTAKERTRDPAETRDG